MRRDCASPSRRNGSIERTLVMSILRCERTRLWESALEFWTYRANIGMTAAMARLAGKSSGGWRSASHTRTPRYGWLVRPRYSLGEIRAQDPPVRCVHANRKSTAPRASEVFLPARGQSGVQIGSSSGENGQGPCGSLGPLGLFAMCLPSDAYLVALAITSPPRRGEAILPSARER